MLWAKKSVDSLAMRKTGYQVHNTLETLDIYVIQ